MVLLKLRRPSVGQVLLQITTPPRLLIGSFRFLQDINLEHRAIFQQTRYFKIQSKVLEIRGIPNFPKYSEFAPPPRILIESF